MSGELEIVNDFSAHIQPRRRRWQRGTTKIGDFPFVKGAEPDPATAADWTRRYNAGLRCPRQALPPSSICLHHSDRGSQYTSEQFP